MFLYQQLKLRTLVSRYVAVNAPYIFIHVSSMILESWHLLTYTVVDTFEKEVD